MMVGRYEGGKGRDRGKVKNVDELSLQWPHPCTV